MSYTDSTMPTSGTNKLNIKLPSTATGSANIVGSGMDSLNTNWNYSDLNNGKESTGDFNADGDAPVVITINTSNNKPTYSVTNKVPAAGVPVAAGTNLVVTYATKTGIGYNDQESVTIKLDSFAPSATVAGYRVVNRELGIDVLLTSTSNFVHNFRVKNDMTIDANDFTITSVEPLKAESFSYDGGVITIKFNKELVDKNLNVGSEVYVTASNGAAGFTAEALNDEVKIYAGTGNFDAGDKFQISVGLEAVDGTTLTAAYNQTLA